MTISYSFCVILTASLIFSTSHALTPYPSVPANPLQQPPSSPQDPSNLTVPDTAVNKPTLQAALDSSDPLIALENPTHGHLVRPRPHILCNGREYGWDLPLQSCNGALMLIPDITHAMTVGPRAQGRWDIETPFRLLSSRYTSSKHSAFLDCFSVPLFKPALIDPIAR